YKRIGEGDTGLNTGGMGAVSPVPFANAEFMEKVEQRIVKPTVSGLIADGIDYRGFIFLGLINVEGEPMVIEYNVRMGDPETEAVMPRVASDLLPLLVAAAKGNLGDLELAEDPRTAVTVMAVSGGYPGSYAKGKAISGLDGAGESLLFHAGTALNADGQLVTSGGRVIAATSYGPDIASAAAKSFKAIEALDFEGKYYRRDIARDLQAL
ncbi:MAG: phosphoribosylamine--glycine ligase, partial [Muribaculaceae bacterium]|nr:phosphoribosylamine--glycine ligase [Muribaculaceae bacterium]